MLAISYRITRNTSLNTSLGIFSLRNRAEQIQVELSSFLTLVFQIRVQTCRLLCVLQGTQFYSLRVAGDPQY